MTQLYIYSVLYICKRLINFWLCFVFIASLGLSLVAVSGGYSSLRVQAPHCSGFSCFGAQALGTWASVVAAHRLSSCGSWALGWGPRSCGARALAALFPSMWNLPRPGIKPISPVLADRLSFTVLLGKSQRYNKSLFQWLHCSSGWFLRCSLALQLYGTAFSCGLDWLEAKTAPSTDVALVGMARRLGLHSLHAPHRLVTQTKVFIRHLISKGKNESCRAAEPWPGSHTVSLSPHHIGQNKPSASVSSLWEEQKSRISEEHAGWCHWEWQSKDLWTFLQRNFFLNYLFILLFFGCAGSLLLHRFSLVAVSRASSSLQCVGLSLWWLLLLRSVGPRARGLQ